MKIVFIVHQFPRVHSTFILNEIVELIKKGHDVSIFSTDKVQEKIINKDVKRFNLLNKTYYIEDFLIKNSFRMHINYVLDKICKIMELINKKNKLRKYIDFINKNYDLKLLAKKIKEENFDIIHAGFGNNSTTIAMILSKLTGIPFTFETHAYDLFVDFLFAKNKIKKAKKIFTISNYNKRYLMNEYGCPDSKIIVKRVTINEDYISKLSFLEKKDDLIMSVCRLHPIKGLEHGIEAVKLIKNKYPSLKYIIIGDGELKEGLINQVKELGLEKVVIFKGSITNEEVFKYMRKASVFLHPSVIAKDGDRDGIPTSMIEAMYLKVPVISSKISGIPELVDDRVNGILTDPGDVNQIAEALKKLLNNKKLREKMGEKGREKVEKEFNIEKNVNKLVENWESTLKNK